MRRRTRSSADNVIEDRGIRRWVSVLMLVLASRRGMRMRGKSVDLMEMESVSTNLGTR